MLNVLPMDPVMRTKKSPGSRTSSATFRPAAAIVHASLLLCSISILTGCEDPRVGPPAKDFFWPLERGKVYEYQVGEDAIALVEISKITQGEEGALYVESRHTQWNKKTDERQRGEKFIYRIFEDLDVITVSREGSSGKATVFAGPVAVGTQWLSLATITGPVDAERKTVFLTAKGYCRIHHVRDEQAFGQSRRCMHYSCPLEGEGVSLMEEGTYCNGLGRLRIRYTVQYKDSGQQPIIREVKLIKVR